MEWLVYVFSGLAIFQVLEYLGKLSVLVGILLFIKEAPERRQAAIANAWLLVNSGNSGQGASGRYQALQYLAKQGLPLEGIRISSADLSGINFRGADLRSTFIVLSKLPNADLQGANLAESNLQNTIFAGANLAGANLTNADLAETDFRGARGISPEQVKKGRRWQEAHYDASLKQQLGLK
jgi:uncharacterized protein YjbI with pentapeptide repeats